MKKVRSFIRYFHLYSFLLLNITALITGTVWSVLESREYRLEFRNEQQRLIENEKERVQTIVEDAVSFIEAEREKSREELRELLKNRVREAISLSENLYDTYHREESPQDVLDIIAEALRPIRFNNGRGYYFIVRLDGTEILYPVAPQFEGQNLLNLQDAKGTYVIRKEISVIRQSGKGFVRDYWTKPGNLKASEKLTYIQEFPPLDIYIGTGEYLEDFKQDIRSRISSTLSEIRVDTDEYLFGGTWEGLTVIGPSVGNNNWNIQDSEGKFVVQELIKTARRGGGFVSYRIPEGIGKPVIGKISYVTGIPEMEWYVGAGFNESKIVAAVRQRQKELSQSYVLRIILIAILFMVITGVNFILLRFFSRKVRSNYRSIERYFNKGTGEDEKIDPEQLDFSEFRTIAAAANRMVALTTQSKKEIEARLKEKETLLREIHHRVKNNLQIITSLLNLQKDGIENERYKAVFQESADRVRVMAVIHEHLYGNDDLSKLELKAFFHQLFHDICGAYNGGQGVPKIVTDIAEVSVDIDTAIPLGLIVNELVSNSLKHSGKSGPALVLYFSLTEDNEGIKLTFSDNGKGLGESVNLSDSPGLGSQLVLSLAEQLYADIGWHSEDGLIWTIFIPRPGFFIPRR